MPRQPEILIHTGSLKLNGCSDAGDSGLYIVYSRELFEIVCGMVKQRSCISPAFREAEEILSSDEEVVRMRHSTTLELAGVLRGLVANAQKLVCSIINPTKPARTESFAHPFNKLYPS